MSPISGPNSTSLYKKIEKVSVEGFDASLGREGIICFYIVLQIPLTPSSR
jgi:hypothetical protein